MSEIKSPSVLLAMPCLKNRTSLSRSCIYAMIAEGKFPAPVQLTARRVAWRESDVEGWIQARTVTTTE